MLPDLERHADGSYRSAIYANQQDQRRRRDPVAVRVVEYQITDPAGPGNDTRYRLMTTILDMAFFADPDGNALMLHHRYVPRSPEA